MRHTGALRGYCGLLFHSLRRLAEFALPIICSRVGDDQRLIAAVTDISSMCIMREDEGRHSALLAVHGEARLVPVRHEALQHGLPESRGGGDSAAGPSARFLHVCGESSTSSQHGLKLLGRIQKMAFNSETH